MAPLTACFCCFFLGLMIAELAEANGLDLYSATMARFIGWCDFALRD